MSPIAFEASLASGERLWWDECSPDWIAGVAGTGTPLSRLVPGGLAQVPGLGSAGLTPMHALARVPRPIS